MRAGILARLEALCARRRGDREEDLGRLRAPARTRDGNAWRLTDRDAAVDRERPLDVRLRPRPTRRGPTRYVANPWRSPVTAKEADERRKFSSQGGGRVRGRRPGALGPSRHEWVGSEKLSHMARTVRVRCKQLAVKVCQEAKNHTGHNSANPPPVFECICAARCYSCV